MKVAPKCLNVQSKVYHIGQWVIWGLFFEFFNGLLVKGIIWSPDNISIFNDRSLMICTGYINILLSVKWKDLWSWMMAKIRLALAVTEAVWAWNFNLSSIRTPRSLTESLGDIKFPWMLYWLYTRVCYLRNPSMCVHSMRGTRVDRLSCGWFVL